MPKQLEPQEAGSVREPLLAMVQIVKEFPGVRALDGVDIDVRAGEVPALLGQNGAGKSTLIKVLAGAHQPNGGTIAWRREQEREVQLLEAQPPRRIDDVASFCANPWAVRSRVLGP